MRLAYATLTLDADAPCRILINGLPLLRDNRPAKMEWMEILDPWMLAANTLDIDIAAPPDVTLTADLRLSLHDVGSTVSRDSGAPLPADLRQALAGGWQPVTPDETGRYSLTGTGGLRAMAVFATHGPDFTTHLRPPRPLDPAEALHQAGSVLQSLARGETDAALRLMAPRLADLALALHEDKARVTAAHAFLLSSVAQAEARRTTPAALTAIQHGPLIEVQRDGGPLFLAEGGQMELAAYFGWTADAVAILR